jgi:hypothetical protein
MKLSVEVTTITGEKFKSGPHGGISELQVESLTNVVKKIKDMNNFSIETATGEVFFNVEHIVTIQLSKEEELK